MAFLLTINVNCNQAMTPQDQKCCRELKLGILGYELDGVKKTRYLGVQVDNSLDL